MRITLLAVLILLGQALSAQCYPDRHNTNWYDAWISCETSVGPIASYGERHWVQYDLGHLYLLGDLTLWNLNHPDRLDAGVQTMNIDISEDGETWTNMGLYSLAIANGESTYEGEVVLDFDEAEVRYILLTIEDTYGDGECAGISEMKAEVQGVISNVAESLSPDACFQVSLYPNPHQDLFNARIESTCGGNLDIDLYDATGRLVQTQRINGASEIEQLTLGDTSLPAGIYFLSVRQDDAIGRYQIVKTD
jgi:hypothetical protein